MIFFFWDPWDPIINLSSAPQKTRFNPHIDGVVRRVNVTFHVAVELWGGDLGARRLLFNEVHQQRPALSSCQFALTTVSLKPRQFACQRQCLTQK
jgi:hypothetical protein